MIYSYKCDPCKTSTTITKPMAESSREEKCNKCHSVMSRVYEVGGIKTGDGVKR